MSRENLIDGLGFEQGKFKWWLGFEQGKFNWWLGFEQGKLSLEIIQDVHNLEYQAAKLQCTIESGI